MSIRRIVAVLLAVVCMLGNVNMTGLTTEAATAENKVTRLVIADYNSQAAKSWGEGMKLTDARIKQLGIVVQGQTKKGLVNLPVKVKEKNQYLHADKSGKVKVTVYYGKLKKTLKFKLGVQPKSLKVKVKGVLYEGQEVTQKTVAQAVESILKYNNGKTVRNFKGYNCKQLGKFVTAKNGKYKLTITIGKLKKTVSVPVQPIKRFYVSNTKVMEWADGAKFDSKAVKSFQKDTTVKAVYKNGKTKTLKNYKVTSSIRDGEMTIKVVVGKKSDRIVIPVIYKVNVSQTEGGTATLSSKTAQYKEPVTLTAKTLEGYAFTGWYLNGKKVATSATYKPEITKSQTFVPRFERISCEVSLTQTGEGKVSVTPEGNILYGEEAVFSAEPAEGYDFTGWFVNGKLESKDLTFKKVVKGKLNVEAQFVKRKVYHTLDVQTEGEGEVVFLQGSADAEENSEVILKANPKQHNYLKEWLVDGEPVGNAEELTYLVTKAVNITAKFVPIEYELTIQSNGELLVNGKKVSLDATGVAKIKIPYGENVKVTPISTERIRHATWTKDGLTVSSDENGELKFKMEGPSTIDAFFSTWWKAEVDATQFANGQIEVVSPKKEASQWVYKGMNFVVRPNPPKGYHFTEWVDKNGKTYQEEVLSIKMEGNDVFLKANFEKNTCIVNVNSNGTILFEGKELNFDTNGNAQIEVQYGAEIELVPVNSLNKLFANWQMDGKPVESTDKEKSSLKFKVEGDVTVQGYFGTWYQVEVDEQQLAEGLVKISKSFLNQASQMVWKDAKFAVTANTPKGYRFVNWVDELTGKILGNEEEVSVPVVSNLKIRANFEQLTHEVTVSKQGQGEVWFSVEDSAETTAITNGTVWKLPVKAGKVVVLRQKAAKNWQFAGWRLKNESVDGETFQRQVWESFAVEAIFEPIMCDVKVVQKGGEGEASIQGQTTNELQVPAGTWVNFDVAPAEHYELENWKLGNETIVSTMFSKVVEQDMVVELNLKKKTYHLTLQSNHQVLMNGKDVEFGKNGKVEMPVVYGETVVLKPVDNEEMRIFQIWKDGKLVEFTDPLMNAYVFIMDGDTEISFLFQKWHKVTLEGIGTETLNGENVTNKDVVSESVITLRAPEDTKYRKFRCWELNGKEVSTKAEDSFEVTENSHFVAKYDEYCDLSVEGEHVSIMLGDEDVTNQTVTKLKNGNYKLVATPAEGYQNVKWTDGKGNELGSGTEFEVELSENKVVVATATRITYPVTIKEGLGTELLDGEVITRKEVPSGEDITVEAVDSEHFKFVRWEDETGKELSTDAKATFKVTEALNLVPKYNEVYDLSVKAENCRIMLGDEDVTNQTMTKLKGNYKLVATPAEGYYIVKWTDGKGNELGSGAELEVELNENKQVVVEVARITYPVTIKEGLGTELLDGEVITRKEVPSGEDITVEAVDSEHFKFVRWEDETGKELSTDAKATFKVTEALNLVPKYNEVYDLSVKAKNGKVMLNGEDVTNVTKEDLLKGQYPLTTEPNEGYELDGYFDSEGNRLGSETELVVELDRNRTVEARFKRIICSVQVKLSANAIGSEAIVFVNETPVEFVDGVTEMRLAYGTKVSLRATGVDRLRWRCFTDEKTSQVLTDRSFTVTEDTSIVAVFDSLYKLTVKRQGGKGKVTLDGKELIFDEGVAETYLVPGSHELNAPSNDDYEFVSWMGTNSSNTPETTENLKLPMPARDMEITVNFREAAKTTEVIFVTQYGEEILREAVEFGKSVKEIPSYPKFGTTFVGWMLKDGEQEVLYTKQEGSDDFYAEPKEEGAQPESLTEAICKRTAEKKEVTVTGIYQEDPVEYYELNVVGGTIVSYKGDKNEEGKYASGTHIYVQADPEEPENEKYFNGWFDENNQKLCDYEMYDFTIAKDTTVEAIYSGEPGEEPQPRLLWPGNGYEVDAANSIIFFTPKIDIPSNYDVIEWGVLFSTKTPEVLPDDQIVLETSTRFEATKVDGYYPNNMLWNWTYQNANLFAAKRTLRVRIFCTITSDTGTETVYSDVIQTIDLSQY